LAQVENNLNIHFKEINQQKAVVDFYRFCDFLEKEDIEWINGKPDFRSYIKKSKNTKLTNQSLTKRYERVRDNYLEFQRNYWRGVLYGKENWLWILCWLEEWIV